MNKIISLIILLLQSVSLFPGGQKVWGIPRERFSQMIRNGSHPVFTEENADGFPLRDLEQAGSGAGYFLSFHHYRDRRFIYRLLEYEIEHGSRTSSVFSARRLLEVLIRDDLDEEAETIGYRLLRQFPDDYLIHKGVVEARYWQEKDISADISDLLLQFPLDAAADSEIALFRAVNAIRRKSPDWIQHTDSLLMDFPAGEVHIRFDSFIRIQELVYSLTGLQRLLLSAKGRINRGRPGSAADLLFQIPYRSLTPALLNDLDSAVYASRYYTRAVAFLEEAITDEAVSSDKALYFELTKSAGFYARRAGRSEDAYRFFSHAYEVSSGDSRQRMLWYLLDSFADIDYRYAVAEYLRHEKSIADESYFSDFFSKIIHRLFSGENYAELEELYRSLGNSKNYLVRSHIAYILYRLEFRGLYQTADVTHEELVASITHPGADPYYSRLYAHYRGMDLPEYEPDSECVPAPSKLIDEEFVRGFFDYGLEDKVYDYLMPYKNDLSPGGVYTLGRGLAGAERYWESIRVAQWACIGDPLEKAEMLYPRGYSKDVIEASELNNHPSWLLFALIRTESYFHPAAGSHAGAIGLTQLMPPTAEDVAGRLGISDYTLSNPRDNITFGSWYLSHMLNRAGSATEAVMAYNAGLTRVRSWSAQMPQLPQDLLIEAVPYTETRNYIKKIIRDSVAYGSLYNAATAKEIYRFFF